MLSAAVVVWVVSGLGLAVQVGGQVPQPGVKKDGDDRGVGAEAFGDAQGGDDIGA